MKLIGCAQAQDHFERGGTVKHPCLYEQALKKVSNSRHLNAHALTILDSWWSGPQQWPWVLAAPEGEILDWVAAVEDTYRHDMVENK